jgi:hypothetical protein
MKSASLERENLNSRHALKIGKQEDAEFKRCRYRPSSALPQNPFGPWEVKMAN